MLSLATADSTPIALWYLERATGVVALVLLTITVGLGIANVKHLKTKRIPRFVVDRVHRNAALLSVVFLALHIITTVLDTYVSINLTDAFVPFIGSYKPFWLGLGALSLDLTAAVVITGLLRKRVGRRVFRAVHWLVYASWPVAVAHSLGTGTDAGTTWMLALTIGCIAFVAAGVAIRLRRPTPPARPRSADRELQRRRLAGDVGSVGGSRRISPVAPRA
jgi:methionine sulfoxide reductase heme-binding subunit